MEIQKVIVVVCASLMLFSCRETVSKTDYDEVMVEYNELKKMAEASREMNLNQASLITQTLSDLTDVSGNTLTLRQNIENNTANITQAEKISSSISQIKEKIDKLEKEALKNNSKNKELIKTVSKLKTIIENKEAEIKEMEGIIKRQEADLRAKDETIGKQDEKITTQTVTIDRQTKSLEEAFDRQIELIYQAGVEFEAIASQELEVSRKSNIKKIEDYKKTILATALKYYEQAAAMGHKSAKIKAYELKLKL